MANRRITALLLAGVLLLGLWGGAALAADPEEESAGQQTLEEENGAAPAEQEEPDVSPEAGTDQGESGQESPQPDPDPEGVLSFANVDSRVRSGDYNCLVLAESIAQVEIIDYEVLREDLRDALNGLADLQWSLRTSGSQIETGIPDLDEALQGIASLSTSATRQTLQSQYDALREQFDDLKEGKLQQEAADTVRQLESTQDGVVMLAQSMYVQLSELQATDASLERALAALDRQLEELELRYELGQISALTLQQTRAGRTSLVSQRESLAASAASLTMSLEAMVGAELTGTLRISALPQVTDQELDAMDLEADLAAAKEASYTLYAAKKTLDDAEETYKDAAREYNYNQEKYQYVQAQHAWQGAQYTYEGAVQSFELSFRTLYAQVQDYRQVLQAAQTALAVEQDNYAVDQLKYEQGTISQNDLLTAQDDLATAQDTVNTARRNLFSAYNSYCWAVERGILN